ncbi:MAG: acetylglutamate kinase, partial [Candidatus Omnitrophica bacterium]|nr:acetylglutamate kinase [Candidatus Omnitrophota bacterium]
MPAIQLDQLVEKADILIEALPYIKRFRGKEVLIKYGGAAMLDLQVRENVLHDLVFMNYVGIRPILIHGGGPEITDNLKRAGVQSKFVNGLRVTDRDTMNVVVETLAEINRKMVFDLTRFGAQAVGLSGHDAEILKVKKHQANGDVGFVGDVVSVNYAPIRKLTEAEIIPVIFPVGFDTKGETYNVNADEAAAKIAAAMKVQKIMVLTNVRGIMKDQNNSESLVPSLHVNEVESLIQNKVITGGMIPKVNCCVTTIKAGVPKAHIVDGRIKHSLLLEIFTDRGIGTEI